MTPMNNEIAQLKATIAEMNEDTDEQDVEIHNLRKDVDRLKRTIVEMNEDTDEQDIEMNELINEHEKLKENYMLLESRLIQMEFYMQNVRASMDIKMSPFQQQELDYLLKK